MGNRANVQIKYNEGSDIFFYSHWDGTGLNQIVKKALIRGKSRWNNESYLARIIFSEMIKGAILEETGYGISPWECEEGAPKVIVDMKKLVMIDTDGIERTFQKVFKQGI